MTGAARSRDNPQTTTSERRKLVIVQRDLDFIGKTMTMNLKSQNLSVSSMLFTLSWSYGLCYDVVMYIYPDQVIIV